MNRTPHEARMLDRRDYGSPTPSQRATDKQRQYLSSLLDQLAEEWRKADMKEYVVPEVDWANLTKAAASSMIDVIKSALDTARERNRQRRQDEKPAPAELEAGMYGDGYRIFKVYRAVHGSGRMVAKELVRDDNGQDWRFEYRGLATRFVTADERMPLDQAKAFGRIYGICCVCAATLTDEVSIDAGIGPVCGGRV